jgi:MFS family permease
MKPLKPDNNVNSNQPNKITCTNNSPSPSPSNSVKISAYAWKMLAILSCIATMVMYAETMLIPGIPDLIRDFHVSYSMSSWILTSYLIAGAVMTPIAGKLSDIYGRKKILLVIMVIYAIGVSIAGFAANMETAIVSSGNDNHPADFSFSPYIILFLIVGVISFTIFINIEKQEEHPLVDFKLMLHKSILPANLIIMLVGFSMFMVFQTVPILVRNPEPVGFEEDAISAGKVQLPFAIVLLIFGPTSGFIISKLGSLRPIIFGTVITTVGFIGLFMFHSSELLVSANLGILSTGLSLTSVGAMNVIILSTPGQFSGISLGMSSLMRIVGSSIGPALAGMYMQTNQTLLNLDGIRAYFPSSLSFNLIFLSAVIVSVVSIALAMILQQRASKMAIPNLA